VVETFRRVLEANERPIMIWRSDGVVTGANDAMLTLLGYSRDDFEAGVIDWDAVTPREYWQLDELSTNELLRTGRADAYVKELVRKDGSRVPVYVFSAWEPLSPGLGVTIVVELTEGHTRHA
jgi:PAS domain S-box-containing protein